MVAWTVKNGNDHLYLRKGNRRRRCRCQNTIKGSNGGYQVAGRLAVRNNENQTFVTERDPMVSDFHGSRQIIWKNQKYNINNLLELKGSSTKLTVLQRFGPFTVKFGKNQLKPSESLVPIFLFVSKRQVHGAFDVVAGIVSSIIEDQAESWTCSSSGVAG